MNKKIENLYYIHHTERPVGLQMFIRYNPARMYTYDAISYWVNAGEPNTLEEILKLFKNVERLAD